MISGEDSIDSLAFFFEDPKSTTGVRKAWNAVTTRDSSSSYR